MNRQFDGGVHHAEHATEIKGELFVNFECTAEPQVELGKIRFGEFLFDVTGSKRELKAQLHGAFTVGLIGRLVSIKNPMLFIDAIDLAKQSLEKRPDTSARALGDLIRGIIVGGGDLEDALRQRIHEKGPEELIVFLGWRRDMAAIYADLDMVMLTSDNEGTPVVLIEAMASGKPFIATDVGSVRDLVDGVGRAMVGETGGHFTVYQNGILVSPKDAQGLASALLYARERGEERARMGRAGRDLAVQRFGKERLLRDIRELYEELLRPTGVERRVA